MPVSRTLIPVLIEPCRTDSCREACINLFHTLCVFLRGATGVTGTRSHNRRAGKDWPSLTYRVRAGGFGVKWNFAPGVGGTKADMLDFLSITVSIEHESQNGPRP